MRSLSEKEREDSEEDYDNMAIASFISSRSRRATPKTPTPKRPTTRLGSALVVDVDDEVSEEPSPLIRKSSKKPTVPKSGKESSVRVMEVSNVEVGEFGEKVAEESGEKVSEKSTEKEKSVRKSVKQKASANEEPGSSKKAKVGVAKNEGRENLRNQKVLWGRTFAPNILDMTGMCQLVDICEFQQWTHLFTNESLKMYEAEVCSFYADIFTVEDDNICMKVNGVDFVTDEPVLGTILGVPTDGISSIEGTCSSNFRNTILKDDAVQQEEWVHKKALLPVYQLLFEMVNKVLLPCAESRSIMSREDMFLMEALDAYSTINLSGIMIEHMKKVTYFKDGNHGLPYEFLLTKVFEFFKVPLGKATNITNEEIRKLKARNVILEGQLSQAQETPSSSSTQGVEVARLTKENADLRKQVEDLKERLLNEKGSANARMDILLRTLATSSLPPPSSAP
uniref:Putative plant transposon protein domain-containing protein n=1 Tax=Nicotiana tabacum TaxID=4097 RepID=A0A1S3XJP0_TOBAC|nr:PREDICTED: uncharacterized protein LOC107765956 [Nicotiana tabacum]